MRRVAGTVLLASLLAGCGGSSPPDEAAAVRATISKYLVAYLSGRGAEACGFYDRTLRASVDARGKTAGVGACPQVVATAQRAVVGRQPASARQELVRRAADRRRVRVRLAGRHATARIVLADEPSASVASLTKVDGRWRISSLGRR